MPAKLFNRQFSKKVIVYKLFGSGFFDNILPYLGKFVKILFSLGKIQSVSDYQEVLVVYHGLKAVVCLDSLKNLLDFWRPKNQMILAVWMQENSFNIFLKFRSSVRNED